jgi:hypothetical protein
MGGFSTVTYSSLKHAVAMTAGVIKDMCMWWTVILESRDVPLLLLGATAPFGSSYT